MFIFSPILLLGPQIFSFIFGEKWIEAGRFAQLLSPWVLMIFIDQGMSKISILVNKQKQSFILNFVFNSVFIVSVYLTMQFSD